jgi:hypothetical protein
MFLRLLIHIFFMVEEKEVKLIEDIDKIMDIIETKIKNRRIIFTDWYKMGIMRKGISEEKFDEVFPQFDKIYKIEEEKLKLGDAKRINSINKYTSKTYSNIGF